MKKKTCKYSCSAHVRAIRVTPETREGGGDSQQRTSGLMTRAERLDSVFTLPFLLWSLSGMLGHVNSSRDSCSHNFFLRRSMTFEPLLAL